MHSSIDRYCVDRYRDWKTDLNAHCLRNRGRRNGRELARRSVPADITAKVWGKFVDLFDSDRVSISSFISLYMFILFFKITKIKPCLKISEKI